MPRLSLAALIAVLLLAVPATASAYRLPAGFSTVSANPADHFTGYELDDVSYDRATHCNPKPRPGVEALIRWLGRNAAGQFWGSYRCEKWGERQASLHAENRAIDWHLDSDKPADRAAGKRLIKMLLASDAAGNPQALARRMGVEEIIWDCSYWGAGMPQFGRYGVCFNKHGQRRTKVNRTEAHIDHLHIGMSKAGAAAKTSFWRATLARR